MNDSILETVKDVLGIDRKNYDFDRDLIPAVNAVLSILHQEGLADEYYSISDNTKTWADILVDGTTPEAIHFIKQWLPLRVKLIFDPPTSSALLTALKETIAELEWRGYITNNYVGEIGDIYGE